MIAAYVLYVHVAVIAALVVWLLIVDDRRRHWANMARIWRNHFNEMVKRESAPPSKEREPNAKP